MVAMAGQHRPAINHRKIHRLNSPGGRALSAGYASRHLVLSKIGALDAQHVPERLEEITGFQLGARYIHPGVQGELIDTLARHGRSDLADISRNDLDIEYPPAQKSPAEQGLSMGARAKKLGSALRIVNRKPENLGDHRGKDSTQVVPRRLALHTAAEQFHTGSKDHVEVGPIVKNLHQMGNLFERRRQVGVPETDVVTSLFQRE